MKLIVTTFLILFSLNADLQEDKEEGYDDFFIPYLEDVLDACDSFVEQIKDSLIDTDSSYNTDEIGDITKKSLKEMISMTLDFGKNQKDQFISQLENIWINDYKEDFEEFIIDELSDIGSKPILEDLLEDTKKLAEKYVQSYGKMAQSIITTHANVLKNTWKKCAQEGNCNV